MPEHLIRLLRTRYADGGAADADLLARVAAGRDDEAFELLVRRHAGLVWRTCRAVARNHHAAEDAFQATFLALATKANAVRGPVAGWLYRVAYHAALKTRRPRDVPLGEEAYGRDKPGRSPEDAELAGLLHEEVNRLPERYRVAVVLCHLHGLTQADAARQLGVPLGTVATRVRRGLDRLRGRLARHGVAAVALVAAPAVADAAPAVTLPAHLTRLAREAVSAMNPVTWKPIAAGLLAAACAAWAVALASPDPTPDPRPAAPQAKKVAKPSSFAQREQTRKALQRLAFATHDYEVQHGHLPSDIVGKDGKPLLSWRVAILPQLDNEFLYRQFKLDEPWDSEHNKKLLAHMPRAFRSPVQGAGPTAETYFQGFTGPGAAFEVGGKLQFTDFQDGTSNTLLLAEAGPAVSWTKPLDRPYDAKKPLPAMDGPHADRFLAATASGDVLDVRWNQDEKVYHALIGRADATVVSYDFVAPPAPPTEDDKKLIEQSRKWVEGRADYVAKLETERKKVLAELKETGGVPPPTALGADASVEEWKALEKRLERQERLLREEIEWLRGELAKRTK